MLITKPAASIIQENQQTDHCPSRYVFLSAPSMGGWGTIIFSSQQIVRGQTLIGPGGRVLYKVIKRMTFAAALTAMITKPTLDMPIKNVEKLLNQNEISWVIEDGTAIIEFLKASPPNSRFRRLVEEAKLLSSSEMSGCYIKETETKSGQFASICDINSIMTLLSQDYSETGTCNYYLTEEKFQMTSNAMHA